jgi:hypothetical protein
MLSNSILIRYVLVF